MALTLAALLSSQPFPPGLSNDLTGLASPATGSVWEAGVCQRLVRQEARGRGEDIAGRGEAKAPPSAVKDR